MSCRARPIAELGSTTMPMTVVLICILYLRAVFGLGGKLQPQAGPGHAESAVIPDEASLKAAFAASSVRGFAVIVIVHTPRGPRQLNAT